MVAGPDLGGEGRIRIITVLGLGTEQRQTEIRMLALCWWRSAHRLCHGSEAAVCLQNFTNPGNNGEQSQGPGGQAPSPGEETSEEGVCASDHMGWEEQR